MVLGNNIELLLAWLCPRTLFLSFMSYSLGLLRGFYHYLNLIILIVCCYCLTIRFFVIIGIGDLVIYTFDIVLNWLNIRLTIVICSPWVCVDAHWYVDLGR